MNGKKSLLYVSPLPPLKSGISDYSVILASALRDRYSITLCADQKSVETDLDLPVIQPSEVDFDQYDHILYNIGNNPEFHSYMYEMCMSHPGMIILHDLSLYYLFVGHYMEKGCFFSKLYEIEGKEIFWAIKDILKASDKNLLEHKELAGKYRFNKEILSSKNKIMVHSEYSAGFAREYNDHVRKINMIPQVEESRVVIDKDQLYAKYQLPMDAFVIASFGIIAETKLNHIACRAVQRIAEKSDRKVCYIMVGEGNYVDRYVDGKTIFKTGYVSMEEFDSFVAHSDMILNLRHPSMGETSAALVKALQSGKACVINDEAWFSEIPDDCAIKLPLEDMDNALEKALEESLSDESRLKKIEKNARKYVETEYSASKIVNNIAEYLEE